MKHVETEDDISRVGAGRRRNDGRRRHRLRAGQGHGRHRRCRRSRRRAGSPTATTWSRCCRSAATTTDLQYAEDDIPNQLAQIENMITKGAKVLVIAAIDGTTLSDALQKAADSRHQGHRLRPPDPRLAERRLLRHLRQLPGRRAAGRLASSKGSACKDGKGPFNIELFGGSPDDNNAFFFYNGAMSRAAALHRQRQAGGASPARWAWTRSRPCAGTAPSPRPAWTTCSRAYYTDDSSVDAVLSPYDGLSIGIISSLKGVGYGTADQPMPVVTGQDAEVAVGQVDHRAASSTRPIFKDTRDLAKVDRRHGRRGARRQASPRSTTPRPTTTASRSSRPTC